MTYAALILKGIKNKTRNKDTEKNNLFEVFCKVSS